MNGRDRSDDDRNDAQSQRIALERRHYTGEVGHEKVADRREREHPRDPVEPAD